MISCVETKKPAHKMAKRVAVFGLGTYGHDVDSRVAYADDCRAMFPPSSAGVVFENSDATHALLVNTADDFARDSLPRLGPSKIVHVAMEPHAFLRFNNPAVLHTIKCRAGRSVSGVPHPALAGGRTVCSGGYVLIPTRMIQYVPAVPRPFAERRPVSLPFSHKQRLAGHKYRHELALALLKDPRNLPVDLWGRGVAAFARTLGAQAAEDPRIKSTFDKLEPYTDYAFTVAIENTREGHYFTEKVYLPIYCGCTPLYLGSPFIETYFPGGTVPLTNSIAHDVELVARACAGQLPPCDTAAAKAYFQQHHNWFERLDALFSN
jgi:hypothetical protein